MLPPKSRLLLLLAITLAFQNLYGQGKSCTDSSFSKTFELTNRSFFYTLSLKAKDGGVVAAGNDRAQTNPGDPFTYGGLITKFDNLGNELWTHDIRGKVSASINIEAMQELTDGSILITGFQTNELYTSPVGTYYDLFVCKLTASGNLIWFKTFHANGNEACLGNFDIRYVRLAEAPNGDLFFCATIFNCTAILTNVLVFKLDVAGNLLWKTSFDTNVPGTRGAYPHAIFYQNNQVTVLATSYGDAPTQAVPTLDLIQLDAISGTIRLTKSFLSTLPPTVAFMSEIVSQPTQSITLDNGNFCVYGATLGNYSNTPDQPQFTFLEFDRNFDLVKGTMMVCSLTSGIGTNKVRLLPSGEMVCLIDTYDPDFTLRNRFISHLKNGRVISERKKISQAETFLSANIELLDDGSYVYLNSTSTRRSGKYSMEFTKMHDSDTSSSCLGTKTLFSHIEPVSFRPQSLTLVKLNFNPITPTNNLPPVFSDLHYTWTNPCSQVHYCDTIKIRGKTSSCNSTQELTLTAFKNKECISAVTWSTRPASAIQMQQVNDTTIHLRFTQQWQGWLFAEINSSCGVLRDSVLISALPPKVAVNLGKDSSICNNTPLKLNAHSGYASYVWNTGATDSTITITSIGTYHVNVVDACGMASVDTIHIVAAKPIEVNIGPDRSICNNDTLHLHAPEGFTNYAWSTNSHNSSITINQPGTYWVEVKDFRNCAGRDSIIISPKICVNGFYMPNAFTPNGDGKNDFFRPTIGSMVIKYHLTIFNRWGEIVFSSYDIGKPWDGKFQGKIQATNVFTWHCDYEIERGIRKNEKGVVVVLR